jgi:hypothetical protein
MFAEPPYRQGTTMERREMEALALRWLHEAIGQNRPETFDELLLTDAEPIKRRAAALHAALTDLQTSLDELLVEGDKLAWRWTVTGTHVGNGQPVTLRGVNFQRIEAGRVAEHWTLADLSALR